MSPPVRSTRAAPEGIAIIGMGCRFPGAQGPETFWELMRNGVDAIREIPPDRPDLAALYDPRRIPGRIISRFGGFLENLDRFDAAFFGISPREAERLDPQQRLLLEVAWEALEDAGQVTGEIGGTDAGVFVGMWINDYEALMFTDPARVDFHMTTGSGRYSASGRLSYVFGLQGPSLTVDTACSSSLVAVHLACQALRNGECSLALAGGANIILAPQVSVAYSQAGMLSPGGRCRFGDAQGDGYVRSDGAGMVVLKPLSRALADGDPIQAVILGSAVNNDGQTSGFLTTPGRQGQEDLLRKAYREAGVDPARVQYVEAHGTGTSAGDPVELAALGRVLAPGRGPGEPCLVGSVKTNIGHTEGAAGVAGLIKVVLSLQRRAIPASLHFQKPNPAIPWSELPLAIPRE
ncbi:MAG TPA: polyketide synthase, partial [Vicinamibacteria bacterium]|nr:polyketide synthase [Vicinamibacteria bacterium]